MPFIPTEEHLKPPSRDEKPQFADVASQLLGRSETLCEQWLPQGYRRGNEYFVGGLDGSAGKSLSINLNTGEWNDFATDDSGGDLISLYAGIHNIKQIDALSELSGEVNISRLPVKASKKPKQSTDEWEHALTVPDAAPPNSWEHGEPSASYRYRDASCNAIGVIQRYDTKDGKTFTPYSWMRNKNTGETKWKMRAFQTPRPLYGMERLGDDKPIVIVEGEKCADALQPILATHTVISWPGGAQAVKFADWSALSGREVTIWPDNDEAGVKAAQAINDLLPTAAILPIPRGAPSKWDAADAIDAGMDAGAIIKLLETAKEVRPQVELGMDNMPSSFEYAKALRPEVIIEGLLYHGSKMLVGGAAKAGKSHFVMDLVASLSRGEKFLKWKPSRKFKVLYVDFELHEWELRERCGKAFNWNVPDTFGRLSLRKHYQVRDPKSISRLLDQIDATQWDVVILDCLYKFNTAEDENDNSQMQAICGWMDQIIAQYEITPILIHHFGKGSQSGKSVVDRFRGASSLGGDMDAILSLTPHEENGNVIVETEVRSFAPTEPFVVKWDYPNFIIDESKDASKHAKPGAKRKHSDDDILSALPVGEDNARRYQNCQTSLSKRNFEARIAEIDGAFITKIKNSNGKLENAYFRA